MQSSERIENYLENKTVDRVFDGLYSLFNPLSPFIIATKGVPWASGELLRNDVIELMTFSVPESSALPSSARTRMLRRGAGAGARTLLAIGAAARAEEEPTIGVDDVERARGDMAIGDQRERERDRERDESEKR